MQKIQRPTTLQEAVLLAEMGEWLISQAAKCFHLVSLTNKKVVAPEIQERTEFIAKGLDEILGR